MSHGWLRHPTSIGGEIDTLSDTQLTGTLAISLPRACPTHLDGRDVQVVEHRTIATLQVQLNDGRIDESILNQLQILLECLLLQKREIGRRWTSERVGADERTCTLTMMSDRLCASG